VPLADWVQPLHAALWQHAIPFVFGPPPRSDREVVTLHSGTCCLVEVDGRTSLITAAHVAGPAVDAEKAGPTDVLVGPLRVVLRGRPIWLDRSRDVASIGMRSDEGARIEAAGYRVVRPAMWPAPPLAPGAGVVVIGYPGSWRLRVSWHELDFRAVTLGMLVHSVHSDYFTCHREETYSEQVHYVNEEVPDLNLAGCSGGPAFLIEDRELLVPHLCGIVSEDWPIGGDILVRLSALNTLPLRPAPAT
jgi:hypothetical protein